MRWSLFLLACVVLVFASTASAQPAPVAIDADVITYDALGQIVTAQGNVRTAFGPYRLFADAAQFDLRTGVVTATGRVRLTRAGGDELRGRSLTYNTRTEVGVLESVEGVVERRIYLRGQRLEVSPNRFVAHEGAVTTCDPARPLYRIVARRVDVVPNQELVAHDASVDLGNRRLFTVPRYTVSLRPGEEGTNLPGIGSNPVDGFWVDYALPVRVSSARGRVHLKYGVQSGPMALLSLTHSGPTVSTSLLLGRTQTRDDRQAFHLLRYDVAEVRLTSRPFPIGETPFSWRASVAFGWFEEQVSTLATTRFDAEIAVASRSIPLAPRLAFTTGAAYRVSSYGTGAVRTITSVNAVLAYELSRDTVVTLGYGRVALDGSTPLRVDDIEPAHTITLGAVKTVPGRYRLAGSIGYNAALSETEYRAAVGVLLTPSIELGASAVYNTRLAAFEDIDYTVRWICDCIDVVVRYRQVRREFSIEFGLVGFPERGAPFVPRAPPAQP